MLKISVAVDVANLQQAESFYVDALECERVRNPYPHMTVLSAGDIEIWLVKNRLEVIRFPMASRFGLTNDIGHQCILISR